jgi:hypothetical protein
MWLSCGRNTSSRPAMLICVESLAPLVPIGSLITCTTRDLAFEHLPFDRQGARVRPRRTARFTVTDPRAKRRHQVGHVQESGTFQPDVDEGRLHARQHAHHLAEVDVAHQPTLQRALDVQFLHRTVLDHGHAGFLRRPIDQNFLLSHTLPLKKYPAQMRPNRAARSAPGSSRISN